MSDSLMMTSDAVTRYFGGPAILYLARRHAGYRTIKRLSEATGINRRRLGHILTFGETPNESEMERISTAVDDGLRSAIESGTLADKLRKALEPFMEH